jgi:hypothetical protein
MPTTRSKLTKANPSTVPCGRMRHEIVMVGRTVVPLWTDAPRNRDGWKNRRTTWTDVPRNNQMCRADLKGRCTVHRRRMSYDAVTKGCADVDG